MTDIVDKKTRSRMMGGIRGKNTQPELQLRRALHARGFRYRLHGTTLPGKPDLVFPKYQAALFVHGCFWHRHLSCKYATNPATRAEFWQNKFKHNIARDQRNVDALIGMGWRVAVVWECEIKASSTSVADEIANWLNSDQKTNGI